MCLVLSSNLLSVVWDIWSHLSMTSAGVSFFFVKEKFDTFSKFKVGVGKTEPEPKKNWFGHFFVCFSLVFYLKKTEYFGSVQISDQTLKNPNQTDNIIRVHLFYKILVWPNI